MGNVEGHLLLTERPVDVVVCDGFVGNIYLKAVEGGISAVTALLRRNINASARAKVGAILMQPVFSALRDTLSYQRHGGAPLLGVNGVVVIAHGRSDASAIQTAISAARCAVTANLNKLITKEIERENASGG
jgi:glycerol-3-phosphate acyltransferase PlsX